MMLLVAIVTGAQATDWTVALTNFTKDGNTYTYEFSETKLNTYKAGLIYVEVPSASVSGTISWKAGSAKTDRFLYIYKENGTVKDETRGIAMPSGWSESINYTSNDILTNEGKYYLVFNTQNDWKATGIKYTVPAATQSFKVSFNPGEHGTYTGGDITEESAGAGITLPALKTLEDGYVFNGWFTAATGGTLAGKAGDTYKPEEDITLYAQYSEKSAPTISVAPTSVSTYADVAVTFTATAEGAPEPTVKWYQNSAASTTGGTEVGTGLTYQPDVTTEGTYYYYAVASNGVEPDATSELITLEVETPVTVYDATGKTSDIVVLTKANFDTYAYMSVSTTNNWNSGKTYGGYSGDFYNMSSTDRVITFKVTGATNYEVFVQNTNANRQYKVGETTITHGGSGIEGSGVFSIEDPSAETTITVGGGGNSVYPVYIQFNVPTTETITISGGVTTYVTENALDFSEAANLSAYAVTAVDADNKKITTAKVTQVPAGTPLLIKGTSEDIAIISEASAITNQLVAATTSTTQNADGTIYVYSKSAGQFKKLGTATIPVGKCYLVIEGVSFDDPDGFSIDFEGEATAITNVNANANSVAPVKVIKGGKLYIGNYNVAGQQVK